MKNPARRAYIGNAIGAAIALAAGSAAAYDWPQFNFDARKSGNNTLERKISRYTVNQLVRKWQVTLPGDPDGSPVVLENVPTPAGVTTIVFVNTRSGHLLAHDARNGALLWSRQYGAGSPHMTTTPAIDPNRQYVYSYGLDGRVHKYQVGDGTEVTTGGWPQVASLKTSVEKHGGALAIATVGGTSYLYVVHGGYPGDQGDYQGHVTTIDLSTGLQRVFNATCSNVADHLALNDPRCTTKQNAVWARPGVVFHAPTNRVLFSTGNAFGTQGNTGVSGGYDWSESILAITPDGAGAAGKPIDSYTPTNWLALDLADDDLGSTAPVILNVPAGSTVAHVGMQGGKDRMLRLFDIANFSGQGGPGHLGGEWSLINIPQGGPLLSQPATWVNPADGTSWTFVSTGSGVAGIKVLLDGTGRPRLGSTPSERWTNAIATASPIVANGVVFATGSQVRAFDAPTGLPLLSTTFPAGAHFHSPAVANGELYVTDGSSRLSAYFLPGPKRDMNGDTRDDIVWRETATGNVGLTLMNVGGATFAPVGLGSTGWQIRGTGDFNGDGRGDLLWRETATGFVGLWVMNGASQAWAPVGSTSIAWQVQGVGDFDGNGKSDVLWRETASGTVGVWTMNGAIATFASLGPTSTAWQVQAVADFDGDARSDVLWRETSSGNLGWWKMNGTSFAWAPIGTASLAWQVAGAGDFDADGWADILWRDTGGTVAIWFMRSDGPVAQVVGGVPTTWQVQRVADYDGDGRADVLWREPATGNTGFWSMNGAVPAWNPLGFASTAWQVQ